MKKQNYKFHINETAPVIPAAPAFGNLLKKANAQIRWYSNPWAWGGFTGIAVLKQLRRLLLQCKMCHKAKKLMLF